MVRTVKLKSPNNATMVQFDKQRKRYSHVMDFDAAINSSHAFLDALSDDELEYSEEGRSARALYRFEGLQEYRELSVEAGDDIFVIRECLPDGWSLVKTIKDGQVGLLPRTYYTFTADFVSAPKVERQDTGEWFPNFRESLLGGKTLNRFSAFVTSGAEHYVLNGTESTSIEPEEQHYINTKPAWKPRIPRFSVLVHSPSKRVTILTAAYTLYAITSVFPSEAHDSEEEETPSSPAVQRLPRITVYRRFSHFVLLHTTLTKLLPGIALPPLPEKQYANRFNTDFIEARRGDLERYINKLVRHPVVRYTEILTVFLSCDNEAEWILLLPKLTNSSKFNKNTPSLFYSNVYHPAFNLDFQDASNILPVFKAHLESVTTAIQWLRNKVFPKGREARLEMAKAERSFAYAILGMITARLGGSSSAAIIPEQEEGQDAEHGTKGKATNKQGAWCWRDNCHECLRLTKALQKWSDTMQSVADLYDDHARRTLLTTHESLKSMAHPNAIYEPIITTHKSTLSRYQGALQSSDPVKVDIAARCETVLNTTAAEMEVYHEQKLEDLSSFAKDHLEGEIQLYEQILSKLKAAKQALSASTSSLEETGSGRELESPRNTSRYELDLLLSSSSSSLPTPSLLLPSSASHLRTHPNRYMYNPTSGDVTTQALLQPPPHVYDKTPMRPVAAAVVGLGGIGIGIRGSVLGRLWS